MGSDKALLVVDGEALATRIARMVAGVADPVMEVGPGRTSLRRITESVPGGGPFLAVVDGWAAVGRAARRPVIIVACDLPLVDQPFLAWLATFGGDRSLVPVLGGEPQPLCARWSPEDLDRMTALAAAGARSFRPLYDQLDADLPGPEIWRQAGILGAPDDIDSPGDIERLGLVDRVVPGIGTEARPGPATTMEG